MAQAPAPEPAAEAAAPPRAPEKKPSSLKAVLVTAVVVGGLAFGAMFMLNKQHQGQAKAAEEEVPPPEEVTYTLASQTVNLADGDRYVRCQAVLAFELPPADAKYFREHVQQPEAEKGKGGEGGGEGGGKAEEGAKKPAVKGKADGTTAVLVEELANRQARLNDALIRELSNRKFNELLTEKDKDKLTSSLVRRFNDVLAADELKPSGEDHEGKQESGDSKSKKDD
ncbi:MAG: flagellar basal body-associated FliL family protein, partial [Armatimonadetes bacterium]|nr:flagellar basal body-associated FliL family protein [Armatimonadota bacterium]